MAKPPKDAALEAQDFAEPTDDDVSTLVTDPDMFAIGWTLAAIRNGQKWTDINLPVLEASSRGLADDWIKQLGGSQTPPVRADVALMAYSAIRDGIPGLTKPNFESLLERYEYFNQMHLFCDVPNKELSLIPLVGQYVRPMHYNVTETRRFSYTAKSTQMFLDVIPFDACRYVYDWLPTADLVVNAFEIEAFQLAYRFALDGLVKHTIRYNHEYLYGAHVTGVNHAGFHERVLRARLPLSTAS